MGADTDRVSIRFGSGDCRNPDGQGRPGLVQRHDRLAKKLFRLLGD